jgi:hypothetical protein
MEKQEDYTYKLRDLDEWHRARALEIRESDEFSPKVKVKRLEALAHEYRDRWLDEHDAVIRKMDEKAEKLRGIADPPDAPPPGEAGIIEELVRERTRQRIDRLYGDGGAGAEQRLVAEYRKAVEKGDTKAAKEFEASLPDLVADPKASGDFRETMKAAKWARMSERQRKAHKDLEDLERTNGTVGLALSLQADTRRRGYRPEDPSTINLETRYVTGQREPVIAETVNHKVAENRIRGA